MSSYKPVVLIPHYNHGITIGHVVTDLLALGLPVLIVDDGSRAEERQRLSLLEHYSQVTIHYRTENGGKGAAVKTGLKLALQQGFTHAVQVDADGQHNLSDIQTMLVKSQANPTALICGQPIYGNDAPKSRLYGRKITNFWIAINTLSTDIIDGMCGFRLYPLHSAVAILNAESLGNRMDFDIEFLVYCHWHKLPMEWVKTPVNYTQDGVSHFRGWADNWLISKMHARLFFKMLARLITGKMR